MAVLTTNPSLPRSLDVNIQVSRPQAETTTDLSVVGAVVEDGPEFSEWQPSEMARVYSSIQAVETDFSNSNGPARQMATAFFSQSPRARRLVIGKFRAMGTPAVLFSGTHTLADLDGIIGSANHTITVPFQISDSSIINLAVTGINLQGSTVGRGTLAERGAAIAAILQTRFRVAADAVATLNSADISVVWDTNVNRFAIIFAPSGISPGVNFETATNLPQLDFNESGGAIQCGGRHSGTFAEEMSNIANAASSLNAAVYAWTLDFAVGADADVARAVAAWIEARVGIFIHVDTSDLALSTGGSTPSLGAEFRDLGYESTALIYSAVENVTQYPNVALAAYALHVDYAAPDSTVTLKFKDLNGVTPAQISETQLAALTTNRYNVLTRIGNLARTIRDGVSADAQYYLDEKLALDNFEEELQVAVLNVFLRNRKVPFTDSGVALIRSAIELICQRYVVNGALASRPVTDITQPDNLRIDPPYTITSQDLRLVTTDQRQRRAGPPFTVQLNLAGAIHTVSVNVEAFA